MTRLGVSWALVVTLAGCSSAASTNASPPASDGGGAANEGPDAGPTSDAGTPGGDDAGSRGGRGDAASSTAPDAAPDAAPEAGGPPPAPAAYITTDDLASALSPVSLTFGDTTAADAVVTVDPTTTYQSIVGFGGSITDSSSYVLTKYLSASALTQVLTKLFDPTAGVGLSFLRQPMGASDFSSVGNYSFDDGSSDPALANFNITQDLKATIPVLKQVTAIDPSIYIIGTPWSAPAWMKQNGSMNGSTSTTPGLDADAYAPFGQYFAKFVQAYEAQGVHVSAVTPQNEPLNGAAAYPGMSLTAPYELQLIGQDLGPAFQSAGLSTLIWVYDHNWDVESYPEQVLADATASGFSEGAAFHCYGGDPSAMTTFHTDFPSKSVYMTECSGGTWQGDPFANTIDLAINSTNNWARVVSLWNIALDENAGPQNDGCNDCRGIVTVNSQTGDVTYNVDYYALGHFSRFVRPGAVRIGSTSSNTSLNEVAFRGVDGRLAFIAHNTGTTSLAVRVGAGATAMNVTVPANAAVTVTWYASGGD